MHKGEPEVLDWIMRLQEKGTKRYQTSNNARCQARSFPMSKGDNAVLTTICEVGIVTPILLAGKLMLQEI